MTKYAKGDLVWHNLVEDRYWTLNMTEAKINGVHINSTVTKVIVDTGTSFFLMPTGTIISFIHNNTFLNNRGFQ